MARKNNHYMKRLWYLSSKRVATRIPSGSSKAPRSRLAADGYFYASEVVKILGLEGIDYAQLGRLRSLVRGDVGPRKTRGWSRYSVRDLVEMRIALELAGGRAALARGRRLRLREVEVACARLRAAGIENPLTELHLTRVGGSVVAMVEGAMFRAADGQMMLTVSDSVDSYIRDVTNQASPAEIRAITRSAREMKRSSSELDRRKASSPIPYAEAVKIQVEA